MYHLRIILISILVFILIIVSIREKFNTCPTPVNDLKKWWHNTTTTGGVEGANQDLIDSSLGPPCPTDRNQYIEDGKTNMIDSCYYTAPAFSKQNNVINFNETGEGSLEYDKMDGVKILKNVTQIPSNRMKNPGPQFGDDPENLPTAMEDLTVNNHYLSDFDTLGDFYRYQVCKKMDKDESQKIKYSYKPEYEGNSVMQMYTSDTPSESLEGSGLKKKFDITGTTGLIKKSKVNNFNDLFGQPHFEQGSTNWVVSRGYNSDEAYTCDTRITTGGGIKNKVTPKICKECPISTIQTYEFNLKQPIYGDVGEVLSVQEAEDRKGVYLVEKGGTYLNKATGDCDMCSFQDGCFSPKRGRVDKYQTKSCVAGQDRECKTCKVCQKGEERIVTFCGEGGATSDTQCEVCTKCTGEFYKVDGCNIDNTIKDTVCEKKTQCRGRNPSDPYDPPPEERTYEIYAGYNGSQADTVQDINGKTITLETPYYGHDRVCAPCDICPTGFVSIGGCVGDNSKSNNICQRVINIKEILRKEIIPPKGYYYDINRVKSYLNKCNQELRRQDDIARRTYTRGKSGAALAQAQKDINKPGNVQYKPMSSIQFRFLTRNVRIDTSDRYLLYIGMRRCRRCSRNSYKNPNNPGCVGRTNTICIPHTRCKRNDMIKIRGTSTSDVVCGPCKCPPGKVRRPGSRLRCNGYRNIRGCIPNESCTAKQAKVKKGQNPKFLIGHKKGDKDATLYSYDKPSEYGDDSQPDRCRVCEKECPPGKFQIGECDPSGSTDLICKDHTKCHPETQITLEPGTATSDTICKCIDGYEWALDEYGVEDRTKPCVKIKGACHTSPCHPNAICYDNFNGDEFLDFTCLCDINDNYIETDKKGVGPNGCMKISENHYHDTEEVTTDQLSAPQISDYQELITKKPKALSVLAHTKGLEGTDYYGKFHNANKPHIHK